MDKYCTSCGAALVNGLCPICSQNHQITQMQESDYQQYNYAFQHYNQSMLCSTCGTQLINGVCPRCTNQQTMYNQQRSDERFKRFFMNPNENLVTTLGNTYIQNFLHHGTIGNGFAIVSDKRVYFHGTSYNIFYDAKGRAKANKTGRSQTIDLKDITGTGFKNTSNIGLKTAMILFPLICVLVLFLLILFATTTTVGTIDGQSDIGGQADILEGILNFVLYGGIITWIIIAIKYFASKISLITIQYAGGELAFNINWFPQQEIADFQRQLRLAKDKAIEESENAVANKFTQAISSMNYLQGQSIQYNSADELMKYADLLQRGLITQDDFENARRRIMNG